jgi:hypothetical protein
MDDYSSLTAKYTEKYKPDFIKAARQHAALVFNMMETL